MSCKTTIVVLAHILSSQDVILHSMFFCLLNCLLVMVFFFTNLLQPDEIDKLVTIC